MAFSAEQLAFLNANYLSVTGKPAQHFVCPITLKDEPGKELCDGHILNDSIKEASGRTVVEYKDVDQHFGATIEPDLVAFLNAPVSTPKELIEKYGRTLTVTLPFGEKAEAFFANRKARPQFPRIDLLDTSGAPIASPYLQTGPLEPKLHRNLQIEWLMGFTSSAIFGSLLKSAHLALFRIMGYRHVLSAAGSYLRQALASFYTDKADKAQSGRYFSKFAGAVKPVLNDIPADAGSTLDDGSLWFHYEPGGCEKNLLFAISCLFRVNGRMVTVMVPYCMDGSRFEATSALYEAALNDSATPQDIHAAWLDDAKVEVNPSPLSVRRGPDPAKP